MKEKTRLLLDMARNRRARFPRRMALDYLLATKEGKQFQRKLTKARRTIANHIREIQREDGHHLARVWARAAF